MTLALAALPLAFAAPSVDLPPMEGLLPDPSVITVPPNFDLALVQTDPALPPPGPLPVPGDSYGWDRFADQTASIPLEAGGLALGITSLGVFNWKWGSSGFRFQSEGWFPRNRGSSGMDKLGHAFSTYVMTEFLTRAIEREADDPRGADITGGLLAMGLMTYVEVFDGFSVDHGFSYEDLVMDGLGAGLSVLRTRVPALRETIDFRLQYIPSGNEGGFHPITDYSGQRYVLAFQFAGMDGMDRSPLRHIELLGGYYARGITEAEELRGEPRRRELFVGLGLNLQQLLFPRPARRWERWARSALDYVQVPYTAVYSD